MRDSKRLILEQGGASCDSSPTVSSG